MGKAELAEKIQAGYNQELRPLKPTPEESFIKSCFLKPLNKKSLKIGKANEQNVLQALTSWFSTTEDCRLVVNAPYEMGLVCRKDKPWLATSVDSLMRMEGPDGKPIPVGVEVKTLTAWSTEIAAGYEDNKRATWNVHCQMGSDAFKEYIKPAEH